MPYQTTLIDKTIFRAYDIRGLVNNQLNENAFFTIGLALAVLLKANDRKDVFIARDGRLSSLALAKALSAGLLSRGINVIDLGEVSTPMMYFATHTSLGDSGLMITGSHNPAEYNGLKMVLAGRTLVQADIEHLYQHVVQVNHSPITDEVSPAESTSFDIEPAYMAHIIQDITLHRPLKVVVDAGNGMGSVIVPKVLRALGCEVIPLYCEVDGTFPNHHPDPTVEANIQDLKRAVLYHKADLGVGFDGDADRLGVVTNEGEIIWPDRLMMFYVQEILQRYHGATIVFDVKCSKELKILIEKLGGKALMCPTGHSIVKGVMKSVDAPLAGEMSGHIFFKDRWFGFDDALYSCCRLLEGVSASNDSIQQQFASIPKPISTPEIKIPIADDAKFEFIRRFSEETIFSNADLITIDGLRVEFCNGWGLLRASNTTPCLVARFEADDHDALTLIQGLFKSALLQIESALVLPF